MTFNRDWLPSEHPVVISGPCSAESEEQVLETCRALAATQSVHILRAGIWKPRTRPDSFQGVGPIGLEWLQKARKETGLPFAVEVANAAHVEACLKVDADILWIGARTTVNPFSVQEIADALKGVEKPVLIKNPINPDPDLWVGAIERIAQTGNTRIGAIHRGFSRYRRNGYRNDPEWIIPIELMRRFPDLPMFCDPSHICGNRTLLASVAQKSMDLGYDGLMIETHRDPNHAWSDKDQQIDPNQLVELLGGLTLRRGKLQGQLPDEELDDLRRRIDHIDEELIDLIATRMSVSEQIGSYKKGHDLAVLQTERWNRIVEHVLQEGLEQNLSQEFLIRFLNAIHQESINRQMKVMNKE